MKSCFSDPNILARLDNTGLSGKAPPVRSRGTLSAPIRCWTARFAQGTYEAKTPGPW